MPKGNLNPKREIVAKGNLKAKTGNLPKREFKSKTRNCGTQRAQKQKREFKSTAEILPLYKFIYCMMLAQFYI